MADDLLPPPPSGAVDLPSQPEQPRVASLPPPPPGATDIPPPPGATDLPKAPKHYAPNGVPLPEGWAQPPTAGAAPPPDEKFHAGPSPFEQALAKSSVGRVLDAFGQGWRDGYGSSTTHYGLQPETEKWLRTRGLITDPNHPSAGDTLKFWNEALIRPAAAALDVATHAPAAAISGLVQGAAQENVEEGITKQSDAKKVGQQVIDLIGAAQDASIAVAPAFSHLPALKMDDLRAARSLGITSGTVHGGLAHGIDFNGIADDAALKGINQPGPVRTLPVIDHAALRRMGVKAQLKATHAELEAQIAKSPTLEPAAINRMQALETVRKEMTNPDLTAADRASLVQRRDQLVTDAGGDVSAAEKLNKLDVVDRNLKDPDLSAEDRKTLLNRKDEILGGNNPEDLEAAAFPGQERARMEQRRDRAADLIKAMDAEDDASARAAPSAPTPRASEPFDAPKQKVMAAEADKHPEISKPIETDYVDAAGNIKLDRFNAPDDVKQAFRDAAEAHDNFDDERRGVVSWAQAEATAEAMGMKPEDIINRAKGEAYNDSQLDFAAKAALQSAQNVRDLALKADGGSDADRLAFLEGVERHALIQGKFSGAIAEAGRSLNILKKTVGAKQELGDLQAVIEEFGGRDNVDKLAKAIKGQKTPQGVSKLIRDSKKPGFWDKFLEYWLNGLLSGPVTHGTYIQANVASSLWTTLVETPLAATVGKVRQLLPGADTERVYAGEVVAELHGIVQGSLKGTVGAWHAMKDGVTGQLPGELAKNPGYTSMKAIPGMTGELIRTPSKAISGIHTFFRTVGYEKEINALAWRQAAKEGLTGTKFTDRVSQIAANPSDEQMAAAVKRANTETYMNRLESKFGKNVEALANSNTATKVIMPFVRVSGNLMRQSLLERTPVGILSKGVRDNLSGVNGAIERDRQIARMMAGTTLGAGIAGLAAAGFVTGEGPRDPKHAALWRQMGNQPYSARIGDTWISYHRMGMLGSIMGLGADMHEISQHMSEGEGQNLASMLAASIGKNLITETGMKGPADLIQAINDPDRYGRRYVNNLASTLVPFSVGMAQVERVNDPDMRDARGFIDTLKTRIPGAQSVFGEVMPRRDIWGQEIKNQGALGPDYLSAMYESRVNNDPVVQELNRLGLFPAKLEPKIAGVQLKPEQYDRYEQTAGTIMHQMLTADVNDPDWGTRTTYEQATILHAHMEAARTFARQYMVTANPQIIEDARQRRVDLIEGRKPQP